MNFLISFMKECINGFMNVFNNTSFVLGVTSISLMNIFLGGIALSVVIGVLTVLMRK